MPPVLILCVSVLPWPRWRRLVRVREQVTRCGPEKKTEGLFAGLAKWSKEKGDSVNGLSIGAETNESRGRIPSWNGRAYQVGPQD